MVGMHFQLSTVSVISTMQCYWHRELKIGFSPTNDNHLRPKSPIIYTFKKIFLSATTHVDGLLALLPALREGVGDLPDGPEEVLARERPQLLRLLGALGDGEREGGRAHRSQPQVTRQVRQQRRQRAQRLLLRQSKGTS